MTHSMILSRRRALVRKSILVLSRTNQRNVKRNHSLKTRSLNSCKIKLRTKKLSWITLRTWLSFRILGLQSKKSSNQSRLWFIVRRFQRLERLQVPPLTMCKLMKTGVCLSPRVMEIWARVAHSITMSTPRSRVIIRWTWRIYLTRNIWWVKIKRTKRWAWYLIIRRMFRKNLRRQCLRVAQSTIQK